MFDIAIFKINVQHKIAVNDPASINKYLFLLLIKTPMNIEIEVITIIGISNMFRLFMPARVKAKIIVAIKPDRPVMIGLLFSNAFPYRNITISIRGF